LRVSRKIADMNAMHGVDNFKICSVVLDILKFVIKNHEYMLLRDFWLPPQCK